MKIFIVIVFITGIIVSGQVMAVWPVAERSSGKRPACRRRAKNRRSDRPSDGYSAARRGPVCAAVGAAISAGIGMTAHRRGVA